MWIDGECIRKWKHTTLCSYCLKGSPGYCYTYNADADNDAHTNTATDWDTVRDTATERNT